MTIQNAYNYLTPLSDIAFSLLLRRMAEQSIHCVLTGSLIGGTISGHECNLFSGKVLAFIVIIQKIYRTDIKSGREFSENGTFKIHYGAIFIFVDCGLLNSNKRAEFFLC